MTDATDGPMFDPTRIERLGETMAGYVERDSVPGLVWLLARGERPGP